MAASGEGKFDWVYGRQGNLTSWGRLYEGWIAAIHRIVIFSTFVKCLKNCETKDIDDTRSIKNI
jgi:hypothetical protein